MDLDQRAGGKSGRIILLGDGTEVLTDSADGDMFDDAEEKDLASQVNKGNREGTPAAAASEGSSVTVKAASDSPSTDAPKEKS